MFASGMMGVNQKRDLLMDVSKDWQRVLSGATNGQTLQVVEHETQNVLWRSEDIVRVPSATLSAEGGHVAQLSCVQAENDSPRTEVEVWEVDTGRLLHKEDLGIDRCIYRWSEPLPMVFTPDERHLLIPLEDGASEDSIIGDVHSRGGRHDRSGR